MKRIAPVEFPDTYDAGKYTEMLLDVTEPFLRVFGFSRRQLGFHHRSKDLLERRLGQAKASQLAQQNGMYCLLLRLPML